MAVEIQKNKSADIIPWQNIRAAQVAFVKLNHAGLEALTPYRTSALMVYSPVTRVVDTNGLTASEALETIERGRQAFDLGVKTHLGLAYHVAGQFENKYNFPLLDYGDYLSLASEGLMQAVARFDTARGLFPSFACNRIRGRIFDEVRELQPESRHFTRLLNQIQEQSWGYYGQYGVFPTTQQIAETMGLTAKKIIMIQGKRITEIPLEGIPGIGDNNQTSFSNMWEDDADTEEIVENGMLAKQITKIVQKLSKQQKKVIVLLSQGLNQSQVAAAMGVTEANVSVLRKSAIANIKRELKETGWI